MKRPALILDGRHFSTKREAVTFFRQMLGNYQLGEMVNPSDHRLLMTLVARHRHADALLSRPVKGFRIAKEQMFTNSRRFEIVREDGSVNDFSYLKCISPPSDPHFNDVMWAMRCDVIEQTRAFHKEAYKGRSTVPCGITGLPVSRVNSQVDHAPPLSFQVVVARFFTESGMRIEDVSVTSAGRLDSCAAKYLADRDLATRWQEYHRRHAQLRVTSKKANLELKKVKGDFSTAQ